MDDSPRGPGPSFPADLLLAQPTQSENSLHDKTIEDNATRNLRDQSRQLLQSGRS
jgi:hypothetical protein